MLIRRKVSIVAYAIVMFVLVGSALAVTYTKRRIGVQDSRWAGTATTWSRLTSTGDTTLYALTPLNVLSRGVVPNGTSDCYDSLQAVINEAEAAGGGSIYLPAGTYMISRELVIDDSYVSLEGEMDTDLSGGTVIKASAATGMLLIAGAFYPGSHVRHVNISNIMFDGGGVATRGMKIKAAGNVAVSGCSFRASIGHSMRMDEVWDSWVDDTYFASSAEDSSVVYVHDGGASAASNQIRFSRCTWESYLTKALEIEGVALQKNNNIYVDNCKFEAHDVYVTSVSSTYNGGLYISDAYITNIRPASVITLNPITLTHTYGAYIHNLSTNWQIGTGNYEASPIGTYTGTSNVVVSGTDYSWKYPGKNLIRNYSATDTVSFAQFGNSVASNVSWVNGPNKNVFSGQVLADTLNERVSTHGVNIDGTLVKDSIFRGVSARLDTLAMKTALHGVVIDPILPIASEAKTADYQLLASDNVIYFSGFSADSVFCTLPTYASVPVGKTYMVINCDATAIDSVYVEASGAEFLNGLATRHVIGLRGYDAAAGYAHAKIMYVSATVGWARID